MDKLVAGPDAAGVVDIRQSPEENIAALATVQSNHVGEFLWTVRGDG